MSCFQTLVSTATCATTAWSTSASSSSPSSNTLRWPNGTATDAHVPTFQLNLSDFVADSHRHGRTRAHISAQPERGFVTDSHRHSRTCDHFSAQPERFCGGVVSPKHNATHPTKSAQVDCQKVDWCKALLNGCRCRRASGGAVQVDPGLTAVDPALAFQC